MSLFSLFICALACASNLSPLAQEAGQGAGDTQVLLAPGEMQRIRGTDLSLTFVRIAADSRCPTGLTCIREGDATVLLRVDKPGSAPVDLTLHTSGPGPRDAGFDDLLITLIDVTPYPREDHTPRPDEYRVTLSIHRK